MRNGGTIRALMNFSYLLPVNANADPPLIELEMTDPSGIKTVWVYGVDVEMVKDSTGAYHLISPPLDLIAGGTYKFIARGPGFPEARAEIAVEPSGW